MMVTSPRPPSFSTGKTTRLNRDSNDADAHRDANACHSPNRCSGNDSNSNSCDEYPFASARQGGAGAVTRCVPAHENSVQVREAAGYVDGTLAAAALTGYMFVSPAGRHAKRLLHAVVDWEWRCLRCRL